MAVGARVDVGQAADSAMFMMRILLSLVLLLLIVCTGSNTDAVPVQTNLPNSNEVLTKEQKNLMMKILADLAELNMTLKDLGALEIEWMLNGKLADRPASEKSPCNFFWKTFSAC